MPRPSKHSRGVEPRSYPERPGHVVWRFAVRWKDPLTGRRMREEFGTDQEALDFKAHLRLLKRRGQLEDLDRGRVLLNDFASRWLHEWAKVNLQPRTLRS